MRIAMITGEYPPLEGGVGDFTERLAHALVDQDHRIHVLTSLSEDKRRERQHCLTVYREIEEWGWAAHTQIMRWLRDIDPDIINIQYQAAAYEMRAGITLFPRWQGRNLPMPIVTTFHDLRTPYLFPKAGPLRSWAVWQMGQYSDGVIVTNEGDYTQLTENLQDETQPQIRLIPIGSNIAPHPPADYERHAWRGRRGILKEDLLLGFFGFLNKSKGVEILLQALARLVEQDQPVHLVFIGGRTGSSDITNAAYANKIDALIAELGLEERVHRTGFITPEEVSAALLATDLCVLPYRDGASLRRGTLHACLAHGRPIVTTEPQTGSSELEDEENVLLIPPEDVDTLVKAILRLCEDPELRVKLAQNATRLANRFSWERIAAHTSKFFEQLIEARQSRHDRARA